MKKKVMFSVILLIVAILDTIGFILIEWLFEVNLGGLSLTFGEFLGSRSLIDWIGNGIIATVFSIIIIITNLYYYTEMAGSLHGGDEIASVVCVIITGFIFGFLIAFGLVFGFGFLFLNNRDLTGVDILPGDFGLTIFIWGINIGFLLAGIFLLILYAYESF